MKRRKLDDLISVGSQIPKALKTQLQKIARTDERTYTRTVRRALEDFVKNHSAA